MVERDVTFTNVFNFRDLGGYPTQDGRRVRWQRLFRSDDLTNLTSADIKGFDELGIHTVVDLRRPEEIEKNGRVPELPGFTYHHVQLVYPDWPQRTFEDTAQRAAYVRERYNEMFASGRAGVGQTLRLIADARALPLVYHCRAGKDRTGVISALTLALLGVADDHIADDYQLSERAEAASWAFATRHQPELTNQRWQHITVNPREGMLGVLADLRSRYGSAEAYAESVGVTAEHIAAMRAHLLE